MQKHNVKLIKKLRLKKGSKYLLFLPQNMLGQDGFYNLSNKLKENGFDDSIVVTADEEYFNKIKAIELPK